MARNSGVMGGLMSLGLLSLGLPSLGQGTPSYFKSSEPDKDTYLVPTTQDETHSVVNDAFIWKKNE